MMAQLRRFVMASTLNKLGFVLAVACTSLCGLEARGQSTEAPLTVEQLLGMSPAQIEDVYRQGTAVAIPPGRVRGTALLATGTRRARVVSRGARLMWNRFFGMRVIRGQLYQGPSWLDGGPSLVLDYSQTSRIYADNRDEIRQIAPGLFLGLMYDRTTSPPELKMYFALETPQ
jgi:hypothetical protein